MEMEISFPATSNRPAQLDATHALVFRNVVPMKKPAQCGLFQS
jgi:hypothetical protein